MRLHRSPCLAHTGWPKAERPLDSVSGKPEPRPSYTNAFSAVRRLLLNTNRQPEKGSDFRCSCRLAPGHPMPLRKSTGSTATRMRIYA